MEDDATRTPSPRSKSARPPAALFLEPIIPAARPAAKSAPRKAAARKATKATSLEPAVEKAEIVKRTREAGKGHEG